MASTDSSTNYDYKSAKELFVSNHTGSTLTHINLVSLIAFTSLCLYTTLRTRLTNFPPPIPHDANHKSTQPFLFARFAVQFILLVIPLLCSVTIVATDTSNALKWNLYFIGWTMFAWWRIEPKISRARESLPNPTVDPNGTPSPHPTQTEFTEYQFPVPPLSSSIGSLGDDDLKKRRGSADYRDDKQSDPPKGKESKVKIKPLPAVTTWRAHMMLMTVICILAVDFKIFPRSLVKCETFGVSLMDIGVGSFIFAQGVTSSLPLLKDPNHLTGSIIPKIMTSIRKTSPLIVLGLVRLILVKVTDYPGEHISEYGTHWNFFLTLAVIPPLQMALQPLFQYLPVSLVGLGISTGHQLLLSRTRLQEWALHAPRTNFLSHNKEGLVSIPGYLAIHLLGLHVGLFLFPPTPSHFQRMTRREQIPDKGSSSEEDNDNDEVGWDDDNVRQPQSEAYANDAWIDYSKDKRSKRRESKKPRKERNDGKTAIELFSYGMLYLLLFLGARLANTKSENEVSNMDVSRRLANLQYVLWVTVYNIFFLLLYLQHDIIFFPSPFQKPRATDTAAQLGPNANDVDGGGSDTWATGVNLNHSSVSTRQGFLDVKDSDEDSTQVGRPNARRNRSKRKSWEGSDLVLRRRSGEQGEKSDDERLSVNNASHARGHTREEEEEPPMLFEDPELKKSAPDLFEAINRNSLLVFLLANVATGLVNLSINTLEVSDGKAMCILAVYLGGLCGFAWTFRKSRLLQF